MAPVAFKIKVLQRGANHLPACTPYLFHASLYHNILIHRPKLIQVHSYPQALFWSFPLHRVSSWCLCGASSHQSFAPRHLLKEAISSTLQPFLLPQPGYPNLIHPGLFLPHSLPVNTLHN